MNIAAYTKELSERGRKGAAWVASQLDEEGNVPTKDLGCAYKCVYPLRIAGYSMEASKLLNRIMTLHGTETGDLRDSEEVKTAGTYTSHFCQVYTNGWVALGAFWLNRFDTFQTLYNGLLTNFYSEETGSFRSRRCGEVEEYDVVSAAMAVEIFLLADHAKAQRAADYLLTFLDRQPDPEAVFYPRQSPGGACITDPHPKSETYSRIKIGDDGQALWFLGMPSAVLVLLYQASGEKKYMDGALRFLETFLSCGDTIYRTGSSGKSLWACSMLYRLTGDEKYLSIVKGIADYFISLQHDSGYFVIPGSVPGESGGQKMLFDVTPEWARWFMDVSAELNGINR